MSVRVSTQLDSSALSLETGSMARQASGSVVVQQGETIVLVTAVADARPLPPDKLGFFPLTCDYRERMYAAGRIPGGFFKREGRPTEKEVLSARLMDRPIRPLFPKGFGHEVQLMATVLSSDAQYDPDVLAVLGASCALRLSSIPFPESLGAVRVGSVEGRLVINPTYQELASSPIDLVVAGTGRGVMMLEGGFREVPDAQLVEAITFASQHIKTMIALQEELAQRAGKPKGVYQIHHPDAKLLEHLERLTVAELGRINEPPKRKHEREDAVQALLAKAAQELVHDGGPTEAQVVAAFETIERRETRKMILAKQRRVDGRSFTDLREIHCAVGLLPRTHGSGLFTRGETQALAVTTLGTSDDEQLIEALEGESYRRFMVHYNFPPFSVGEVRPLRGTGRREVGHGALAERALTPVIPSKDDFPYTIRVVSDILESNGSSSMATVCAGSLSLMDAGVPVRAAISGVAMGLIKEADRTAILTDISGLEDHVGDMDFKLAGTSRGATALQLDVKLAEGLTLDLVGQIVRQAAPARMKVLELMASAIQQPRPQISSYAPRITRIKIDPEKIRDVIGPGGRTIRKITEETGAKIDIEDDGSVSVASPDAEKSERAVEIIRTLTENVEVGKVYNAKVKRIMNFGAFCEILPGKEGLVHVSELDDKYVNKVEDVVKIGDQFPVKVIEIDEQGRVNLSRKRAMERSAKAQDGEPRPSETRRRG